MTSTTRRYDLSRYPNVKAVVDTRSVQEIIDNINHQGELVAQAMGISVG